MAQGVDLDNDGQPQTPEAGGTSDAGEDLTKLEPAELAKRLEERDKSYKELRSLHDRQMQQLRDDQKAINERLVAALEKATAQPEPTQADPSEIYQKWGERFDPDDPEKGATIAEMVDSLGRGWMEKLDARINEIRGTTENKILALDPDYRQNKELVDELVESGLSLDKALDFARKHPTSKAAAQPGRDGTPGRTATDTRSPSATANRVQPVNIDATTRGVMKMALGQLGIKDTDAEIATIAAEVAKDQS